MDLEAIIRQTVRDVLREELRAALAELKPQPAGEFLTIRQASEVAKVAPDTLRRWIAAGRLRAHRAGRVLRIARPALEAFLAEVPEGDLAPEAAVLNLLGGRRST